MTLEEIFERALVSSGQFLLSSDCIEMQPERFLSLVKLALSTYNKYSPNEVHLFKNLQGNRQYTFTDENTEEGIPDYISDCIPMRVSGTRPFFLRDDVQQNPQLDCKKEFPFVYRKPTLTVMVNADYDILAVYKHKITSEVVEGKTIYELKTISDDDETFLDLVTARFLKGLGRSRRAFTLTDLPITADAADLVSEGESMEERVMETLKENEMKFWLAWR